MDRSPAALAVLVLAVTAGCNAPVGTTDDPTATVTPAAVPTPEERTTYPPGFSANGIEDPRRAAQSHADVITDRSYNWTLTEIRYGMARVNVDRLTLRRVGPTVYNGTRLEQVRRRSGVLDRRTGLFADGDFRYIREPDRGGVNYTRTPARVRGGGEGIYEDTAEALVERYLAAANVTVTPLDDGRFRVVGRDTTDRYPDRESYTVVATVRPSGLIETLLVRFATPDRVGIEVRWSYTEVGTTTLSDPDWYPAARNVTAADTTADAATARNAAGDAAVSPRRARPARSSAPDPAPRRPRSR